MSEQKVLSWVDVPASKIVNCLGEKGDGYDPQDIIRREHLNERWGFPLELLPVGGRVDDDAWGFFTQTGLPMFLVHDGTPIAAMQGVIIGDLIDTIAAGIKPLGFEIPGDLDRGYSESRLQIAKAIVGFLTTVEGVR